MSDNEVFASILEEQVALLQKQIARLRGEDSAKSSTKKGNKKKATDDEPPADTGKKKRKVKSPKDPNKPKVPLSNYMLFSQEVMPRYRVEDPTKQTSELMKLIGKEWNEMDPERKAVYSSKAAGLRENYHKEMSAYKASQTSEASASSEGTEKPNEKSVSLQVVPDAESHSAEKKKKKRKHRERDTDHENSGEGEVVKKKKHKKSKHHDD